MDGNKSAKATKVVRELKDLRYERLRLQGLLQPGEGSGQVSSVCINS